MIQIKLLVLVSFLFFVFFAGVCVCPCVFVVQVPLLVNYPGEGGLNACSFLIKSPINTLQIRVPVAFSGHLDTYIFIYFFFFFFIFCLGRVAFAPPTPPPPLFVSCPKYRYTCHVPVAAATWY